MGGRERAGKMEEEDSRCLSFGGVVLELRVMDGEEGTEVCRIPQWVNQTVRVKKRGRQSEGPLWLITLVFHD